MAITGLEPWFNCHEPFAPKSKTMLIIGAGLAGASMALQAVQRGWTVTVLDRHGEPAQGSSGNAVAIVYPLIAADRTNPGYALSVLGVQCLKKSLGQLGALRAGVDYGFDGVMYLALTGKDEERLSAAAQSMHSDMHCDAQYLTASQASELAGVSLQNPALHLLNAGWLKPQTYCRAALDYGHSLGRLQFCSNTDVTALSRSTDAESKQWIAHTASGQTYSAEAVVVCGGFEASQFTQTKWLPIQQVRGQVDCFNSTQKTAGLKLPLCANGYIAPVHAHQRGMHVAGATFDLQNKSTAPLEADSAEIAALVGELGEDFRHITRDSAAQAGSRVSFRSTSPDALPMVGVVPIQDQFMTQYAAYASGVGFTQAAPVHSGLFTLTGLGARGAVYAPSSAQLLMDYIDGTPCDTAQRALFARLHTARFLLRQIKAASR